MIIGLHIFIINSYTLESGQSWQDQYNIMSVQLYKLFIKYISIFRFHYRSSEVICCVNIYLTQSQTDQTSANAARQMWLAVRQQCGRGDATQLNTRQVLNNDVITVVRAVLYNVFYLRSNLTEALLWKYGIVVIRSCATWAAGWAPWRAPDADYRGSRKSQRVLLPRAGAAPGAGQRRRAGGGAPPKAWAIYGAAHKQCLETLYAIVSSSYEQLLFDTMTSTAID